MTTENQLEMSISEARGLALLIPKSDVRFYLNGLYIDFATRRAIVTDGHRMICVNFENGKGNDNVILPRDEVLQIIKGGSKDDIITVGYDSSRPESVTIARSTGVAVTCKPIYGHYPDYERVIPDKLNGKVAQFNPDYISQNAKALGLVTGCISSYTVIRPNGDGPSVMFIPGTEAKSICVIMPFRETRDDKKANPQPQSDWLAVAATTAKSLAKKERKIA